VGACTARKAAMADTSIESGLQHAELLEYKAYNEISAKPQLIDGAQDPKCSDDDQNKRFLQMAKDYKVLDEKGECPGFCSDPFGCRDFSRDELRIWMPRVAFAFCFVHLGIYVNSFSQAWLQNNIAGYYETRWKPVNETMVNTTVILWDVVFQKLPAVNSTKYADLLAALLPTFMFIRFAIIPGPMSLRWTIICRVWVIWGVLWFFRAATILITPLPNPWPECVPQISYPDNNFLEAFSMLPFVFWTKEITCQDVLYSGHTVAITLPMLTFMRYIPLSPWFPYESSHKWLSWSTFVNCSSMVVLLGGYFLIAASHFHYTVDVFVAVIMSSLVFYGYHNIVRINYLHGLGLSRSHHCLVHFADWYECYSKDLRNWHKTAQELLLKVEADRGCEGSE